MSLIAARKTLLKCFIMITLFFTSSNAFSQTPTPVTYPKFCSGSTIDISTVLLAPGKNFKWTVNNPANISDQTQSPTSFQPTITQKITYTGFANNTPVIYNVTDDAGARYTLTVLVFPIPSISNLNTWNNLSNNCGNNINFTPLSTIPVTTWNWSRPAVLGYQSINSTSNVVFDNISDTTNTAENIPYTIVMTAQNGCINQQILSYRVFPTPFISDPIKYDTICSGTPISFIPKTQLSLTIFTWALPTPSAGLLSSSLSAATAANNFTSFNQTIVNTTANSIITSYNIIPIVKHSISLTCTGLPYQKFVIVNPKPNIVSPVNVTVCSGTPFKSSPVTGGATIVPTSTQYTWTMPQYSDASLSGGNGLTQTPTQEFFDPPISQTLINKSAVAQTATYNVTAKAGSCSSLPFDLVVTVNPVPVFSGKDSLVVCSGTAPTFYPPANTPVGVNYSWSAPQVTPSNSLSGTGTSSQVNQLSFAPILINQNTSTSVANFSVIATTQQGCIGTAFPIVVSVNPAANVSVNISAQTLVTCSGSTFISSPSNVPQNTLYTWKTPSMSAGVSIIGSGQNTNQQGDSSITGNLNYTGVDSGGTATYTIIPKSGICTGSSFNLIVTVRPLPNVSTVSQTVCSESSFSTSPTSNLTNISTYYTWDLPQIAPANSVLGASANTSPLQTITQTLKDTTNNIAQATYTVTPTALGCVGKPFTFIAVVNPTPNFLNKDTIVCPSFPFTMNPSPLPFITNYTWESPVFNIPNSVIGAQLQLTPVPSFSQLLTNTTNSIDAMATYKVTPRYGDCVGKPFSIVVTVKASPYITDTLTSIVCSGSAFAVKLPNNLPIGSQFYWDEPSYTNGITGGSAQTVLQNTISQTLRNINSDTSSGKAFYPVTPVANGCKGNPFTVKVTVKANSATLISDLTLPAQCSGINLNYVPVSNFPGTAFSWFRDSIPGLQNAAATGYSDINEILVDTIGEPIRVNYRFSLLYNGCVNLKSQIVTLVINPKPVLSSSVKPVAICSGNTFNYTPVSSTRDVTFNWARSYVVGITEALTNGVNSISENLQNTTFNIVQVPYVFTLSANGCSNQQTVYEVVNPVLTLQDMTSPVCSGTNFKIVPPNTVNAVFLWQTPTMSNGVIGGTDNTIIPVNSINGSLTNLTDTTNIATYNIQPIIPGASTGGCLGKPFKLIVVVNPIPVLSSATSLAPVCSSTPFQYIPTSKTPGTIFSWTRDSIVGISNKPSKGSYLINETLVDSTVEPVFVSYKYKTTFNGCTDSTQTVSFVMNPAPIVPDQKLTICSGTPFVLSTSLEPLRTTYTWNSPSLVPDASITGYTSKLTAQTLVYDTLNNLLTSSATAIYTIQPAYPNCKLQPFNLTVTVKPISLIGDQTVNTCNGKKMVFIPSLTPSNTLYKWAFNEVNPSFALSGYGSNDSVFQASIIQTLSNSSNNSIPASYLITSNTNGCIGKPFQLKAKVNPTPRIKITGPQSLCENASDSLRFNFTGTSPWSISYIDNKDNLLTQVSGFTDANSLFVQPIMPKAATYTFSVVHVNDAYCSNDTNSVTPVLASITQNLRSLPSDTILAPNGTLICVGLFQPMVITPIVQSYQWFLNGSPIANATSINFNAYAQGTYSAKVTDSLGCSNMTVNSIKMIDLKNFSISFTNDSINCINTIKQFLNNTDTSAIRNIKWKWNFNGEDSTSNYNGVTNFKKAGLKKISLSAIVPTCAYSITKDSLISIAAPKIPVNLDFVSTNAGKPTPLQARKFEGLSYKYNWQPVWGLDFLNINNPIFNYNKSQKYFITMTAPDGCITVDTLKVNVFDSAVVNIFVPRSFSPNGDGVNDVLFPYIAGMKVLTSFKIINKFGKLMFETKTSSTGWDGISYGEKQPMDAYMWMAEGIDNNGIPIKKTGNLLLIR